MERLEQATISVESGVEGDFRGRQSHRKVTVVTHEGWEEACRAVGSAVDWTARRANLLIDGLGPLDIASGRLRIGTVVLDIAGETRPCDRMDEACAGLQAALEPGRRAGSYCRVLSGGVVRVGDPVIVEGAQGLSP
jgi:MOSC domain-containing protein YiiM